MQRSNTGSPIILSTMIIKEPVKNFVDHVASLILFFEEIQVIRKVDLAVFKTFWS